MASPLTLRLDEDLRRRVARIAKRKHSTTSAAVREAIESWVAREETVLSPYELMKDLIGSVKGGDPKLSENTGRRFTELLRARSAKQ